MKRVILLSILAFITIIILTQVGWLSNGFFGFRIGILPEGASGAILLGVIVVLAVLTLLKILRWWKK